MKTLVFVVTVLMFSLANCYESTQGGLPNGSHGNKVAPTSTPMPSCPTISSETAVLIAKGYLCLDYDLKDRDPKVEEDGDSWKVTLHRTSKGDLTGGDPVAWINKADGSIKSIRHAK